MKQPGLRSRVGLDFERGVVIPGDMQTSGQSHDIGGAISAALLAGRFILGRIERIADAASFSIQGQGFVNTFFRRDHSKLPVFGDHGYPVAGEVDRRAPPRVGRSATTAAPALSEQNTRKQKYKKRNRREKPNRPSHLRAPPMQIHRAAASESPSAPGILRGPAKDVQG